MIWLFIAVHTGVYCESSDKHCIVYEENNMSNSKVIEKEGIKKTSVVVYELEQLRGNHIFCTCTIEKVPQKPISTYEQL